MDELLAEATLLRKKQDDAVTQAMAGSKYFGLFNDKHVQEFAGDIKKEILAEWDKVVRGESKSTMQEIVDKVGAIVQNGLNSGGWIELPITRILLKFVTDLEEKILAETEKSSTWRCYGFHIHGDDLRAEIEAMVRTEGSSIKESIDKITKLCTHQAWVKLPLTDKTFRFDLYKPYNPSTDYGSSYGRNW
jgi:hypothetical protein